MCMQRGPCVWSSGRRQAPGPLLVLALQPFVARAHMPVLAALGASPQGPALTDKFWILMVTWHMGAAPTF